MTRERLAVMEKARRKHQRRLQNRAGKSSASSTPSEARTLGQVAEQALTMAQTALGQVGAVVKNSILVVPAAE